MRKIFSIVAPDPELLNLLRTAKRIAVLTGAGVSAESGIPTFRDAMTGLWAKFDPAELATPQAFARDPAMVTRWYDERRCNVAQCRPNPGHIALATLQNRCIADGRELTLITQNVDRLHQAAGSTNVIELHGTLWVWRCIDCGEESEERGPAFAVYPPRCSCGGNKRPGVVWFGEELSKHALLQAQRAAASCDLFLALGTSSVVYPAAGLIDLASKNGANVLEVNPEETAHSRKVRWSIRGKCGDGGGFLLRQVSPIVTKPPGRNPVRCAAVPAPIPQRPEWGRDGAERGVIFARIEHFARAGKISLENRFRPRLR